MWRKWLPWVAVAVTVGVLCPPGSLLVHVVEVVVGVMVLADIMHGQPARHWRPGHA